MRNILLIVGILLIIASVVLFSYSGFEYTTQDKIAEIGPIKITADEQKTIMFHPAFAVLSLLLGIVSIVFARKK